MRALLPIVGRETEFARIDARLDVLTRRQAARPVLLVVIATLALASCVACDDLTRREQEIVRSAAACSVDADCRVVAADGCHVLCSIAIATTSDATAIARELQDVRADAVAFGCACPVADCVPTSELTAACVEGVCGVR